MQKLANQANFANWKQAQHVMSEVIEAINSFHRVAIELGVTVNSSKLIGKQLKKTYQDNKSLLKN